MKKTKSSQAALLSVGLIALALISAAPAKASVIVAIGSATVAAGGSGSVDVTLQNTGSSTISVSAFFFEFSTSNSFVTFTSANTSTSSPYIFGSLSLFGPVISVTPPPDGQLVDASDANSLGAGTSVSAGTTVGLGHVLFTIAPGAPSGTASLVLSSAGTSLSDAAGALIPITTLGNGQITITGTSVPEPATWSLCLLGAAYAGWLKVRARSVRFRR